MYVDWMLEVVRDAFEIVVNFDEGAIHLSRDRRMKELKTGRASVSKKLTLLPQSRFV
jgi:hypothetical protein